MTEQYASPNLNSLLGDGPGEACTALRIRIIDHHLTPGILRIMSGLLPIGASIVTTFIVPSSRTAIFCAVAVSGPHENHLYAVVVCVRAVSTVATRMLSDFPCERVSATRTFADV
uniref:Uncharacterized protein n=1 Tax=Anopheles dirus TaxID=7168 RepID=A0A182NYH1_9DIPT